MEKHTISKERMFDVAKEALDTKFKDLFGRLEQLGYNINDLKDELINSFWVILNKEDLNMDDSLERINQVSISWERKMVNLLNNADVMQDIDQAMTVDSPDKHPLL